MKEYEILTHPADLKIKIKGKGKEELFLNALKGMADSQKAEIKNKEKVKREIKLNSLDLPALLVDFLNNALYLSQVNKESYFDVRFEKFTDTEIEGELIARKAERFGEDIKAATHHDMNVGMSKEGIWEATILFDI